MHSRAVFAINSKDDLDDALSSDSLHVSALIVFNLIN